MQVFLCCWPSILLISASFTRLSSSSAELEWRDCVAALPFAEPVGETKVNNPVIPLVADINIDILVFTVSIEFLYIEEVAEIKLDAAFVFRIFFATAKFTHPLASIPWYLLPFYHGKSTQLKRPAILNGKLLVIFIIKPGPETLISPFVYITLYSLYMNCVYMLALHHFVTGIGVYSQCEALLFCNIALLYKRGMGTVNLLQHLLDNIYLILL